MKRYLYILLVAVVALVSCDPFIIVEERPDVAYYFGAVEVEAYENSAIIDAYKPYVTINGEQEEGTIIYLEYWVEGNDTEVTKVENYAEAGGGYITFELAGLTPDTAYRAVIAISGEYGEERSDVFPFTTKEHIPVCTVQCSCSIEPYGLFAEVEFTDVVYLADGQPQDITRVKLEYARANSGEWVGCDFVSDVIKNGVFTQKVPFEDNIFEECCDYKLRLTLDPKDDKYESVSSEEYSFKTIYAEVAADIATPTIEIVDDMLKADVKSAKVLLDGIEISEYSELDYGFIYRKSGQQQWSDLIEAEYAASGMSTAIALAELQEGATYEFCGAVVAGMSRTMCTSQIAKIEIPKSSTPPAPPISGDADTADIAGQWQLTAWRGAEPSFDVYLSITEDGVVSLFQRIESRLWETYYSTVAFDNGVIAGVYTDGVEWANDYYVALEGNTMTWTSTADNTDISVYTRCTLPDMTNPEIRTMTESGKRFL